MEQILVRVERPYSGPPDNFSPEYKFHKRNYPQDFYYLLVRKFSCLVEKNYLFFKNDADENDFCFSLRVIFLAFNLALRNEFFFNY